MPENQQLIKQYCEYESDTQSIISSEFDELNYARIYDTNFIDFLTPSKKKSIIKKKIQKQSDSDSSQDNWRELITRTISLQTDGTLSPKYQQLQKYIPSSQKNNKINKLNDKTPTKKQLKQQKDKFSNQLIASMNFRTITVRLKDTTEVKYQNLCSICLDIHNPIQGELKCNHKFCFQCIQQWTKTSTNCPCCRYKFTQITKIQSKFFHIIKVQQKQMVYNELDYFICTECNRGDDEDVLLICDGCDFYCSHVYCDRQLNNRFPTGDWFCRHCKYVINQSKVNQNHNIHNNQLNVTERLSQVETALNVARTQTLRDNTETNINMNQIEGAQKIIDPQKGLGLLTQQNIINKSMAVQIFSEYKPQYKIQHNQTTRNLRNMRRRRYN